MVAGCGAEAASPPLATVRDSAGVTIVENPGLEIPGGGGWGVASEPRLVLGSLDGPEESQLFQVEGALLLPDGRIAVGNRGSHQLRYYGPDGVFSHADGGEGEGPGEFTALNLIGRRGDSLVVLDRRQRRISLFHPDQGFVRSFTPVEAAAAYPMRALLFSSGTVLLQDLPGMGDGEFSEGFDRDPIPHTSCTMEGEVAVDFGELPGAEMMTITRRSSHGIATLMTSVPFGKSPQAAVGGDLFYYGSHDGFQVNVYGSDGNLRRIVRVAQDPAPVTEEDFAAFVEEDVARFTDENQARSRRRDLEGMPLVESRPPHGAIFADAEGWLFVEEYVMPGQTRKSVSVFDPQGALAGSFELPAELEVLDVGPDYLLGLYEDEYEVEYLGLFDLVRPRS